METSFHKKIHALLTPKERRSGYILLCMILVMAFLEMVGVASIMPFVSVLANPEAVQANPYLAEAYERLGFEDTRSFMFFLGIVMMSILLGSIAFKALTAYAIMRFTLMRGYSLSKKLVQTYLRQPYEWFLNRNSADLGKSVLSEANLVISGVLMPLMRIITSLTLTTAMIALLMAVEPALTLVMAACLGISYGLIYFCVRMYLLRAGQARVLANKERFQAVQEAFGGIKEVKVSGLESPFLKRFQVPALDFARLQVRASIVGELPNFALQGIAYGGAFILIMYLMTRPGGLQEAMPVLAVFALAGQKMLPAIGDLYKYLSTLRFNAPALDSLYLDIVELKPDQDGSAELRGAGVMGLQDSLQLADVVYTYPNAERSALRNLNLVIPAKSTIGLVGATGSGKTTTVDLILGLLTPDEGRMLVDGEVVLEGTKGKGQEGRGKREEGNSKLKAQSPEREGESGDISSDSPTVRQSDQLKRWQRALGYVPQHIYLADDTVAANIAFGIPPEKIDMEAVIRAAETAELSDFVDRELPKGYQTMVGERGVRLSGGQRQRIGIARALYHDPAVLIFDEATSALDNITERMVMKAIKKMHGQRTIILIAHRLSTVQDCDRLFLLQHGEVVAQGNYDEMVQKNKFFRMMTK